MVFCEGRYNRKCIGHKVFVICHVTTQENKFSGHYALLLQEANRHQDSKVKASKKKYKKQVLCNSVTTQE